MEKTIDFTIKQKKQLKIRAKIIALLFLTFQQRENLQIRELLKTSFCNEIKYRYSVLQISPCLFSAKNFAPIKNYPITDLTKSSKLLSMIISAFAFKPFAT